MDSRLGRAMAGVLGAAFLALPLARAQDETENAGTTAAPAAPTPIIQVPSQGAQPQSPPPTGNTIAPSPETQTPATPRSAPAPSVETVGPPAAVRSPTAILRVLDKVTAETMRFEAPVGKNVRYKTLIFTVKACETRGLKDPQPRPSAYLVIDSEPPAPPGRAAEPAKEIYRGWMFAEAPDLHPFEHPVYDAWLEACTSASPAS